MFSIAVTYLGILGSTNCSAWTPIDEKIMQNPFRPSQNEWFPRRPIYAHEDFQSVKFYTFLDLIKRTCTSECIFRSYRCEVAGGTARTALYWIVTFIKANYFCSLLSLSQDTGNYTVDVRLKSRPHIFKSCNVFKLRSFLTDNLQVKQKWQHQMS